MTVRLSTVLAVANVVGLFLTAVMVALLFRPGPDGIDALGYHWGRDFANFWGGARLATSGSAAVLYDLAGYHAALKRVFWEGTPFLNFSYPPTILPLIAPLALMPYPVAFAVWSGLGVAAAAWVLRLGRGRFDGRASMLLLLSPAVCFTLVIGQASAFFAAMVVGGLYLRPNRPILAGVLFGLATVKPQLGVILAIYLLWVRDFRAIAAAVATAAALIGVSLAVWGVAPWQGFVRVTLPYQADILANPRGFFSLLEFSPFVAARFAGLEPAGAWAVHLAAVGLGAGTGVVLARRGASTALTVTVLALGTVLVTPYALAYDLVLPATALVVWAIADDVRLPRWAAVPVFVFWITPPLMLLVGIPLVRFGAIGVLPAVVALAAAELRRTRAGAAPTPRA